MNPYSNLLKPLAHHEFYALLVLTRREMHVYAIKSEIIKASLGSIEISDGRLRGVIIRLHDEGFIDLTGPKPAGKSGKARTHYAISELGKIRLQEEYQRLHHALEIIEHAGLVEQKLPTDLQRLLLQQT